MKRKMILIDVDNYGIWLNIDHIVALETRPNDDYIVHVSPINTIERTSMCYYISEEEYMKIFMEFEEV